MSERYVIKDRWIFDTKLNKNIHSIDCYEEKSILDIMNSQDTRISELEEQLKNAIVPKFKIGDYFIEYWNKEPNIYQYQGNKHFKCLNKAQGYHCDYIILGALLIGEDFIKPISQEEAEAKLEELKGE